MIENDHSKLQKYYEQKNVIFAKKNNPVYLRSISSNSITAINSKSSKDYINSFGNWRKNKLKNFLFLGHSSKINKQSFFIKLKNIKIEISSKINYKKYIFKD